MKRPWLKVFSVMPMTLGNKRLMVSAVKAWRWGREFSFYAGMVKRR